LTVSEYNECVDNHADGLYRFILKHIKDTDKAKDIVQDTFEKLWRKVSDVPSTNAKSYMFTTAYRTLIDQTRIDKRSATMDEVIENNFGHSSHYSDLGEILNKGLDLLPEIQKSVLLLRDYEGYDYLEIGKITGLNESQVKVYIYRARNFLKEYIGSMDKVI
jgi:RNA polymerase sigma factor (sigma-70 family)